MDASSFWCVVILSLYFTLNFVISSLIVGTFKTACKTLLDIYTTDYLLLLGGLHFDISVIFQSLNYWLYHRELYRVSRWALEWFCTSVTYFLLIAPIFFLSLNTFVGISPPAVFF